MRCASTPWKSQRTRLGRLASVFLLCVVALQPGCQSTPDPCNLDQLPQPPAGETTTTITEDLAKTGKVSGANLRLPKGTTLQVSADLQLVARGSVTIDGEIKLQAGASAYPNLTLASLDADVSIGGSISGGPAGSGVQGGVIRIVAPKGSISIAGSVVGVGGAAGAPTVATQQSGRVFAEAKSGGDGREVILCALRLIDIAGELVGGAGGDSGTVMGTSTIGSFVTASGRQGRPGGKVTVAGSKPGPVAVQVGRLLAGGRGGNAQAVEAIGLRKFSSRNDMAVATGSKGGKGGDVEFRNATLTMGTPNGGDGGRGSDATATAGTGRLGLQAGDDAQATAGNGGAGGEVQGAAGMKGKAGGGGNAKATPGNGTPGTPGTAGGPSGTATATGGANGAGKAPPSGEVKLAPVPGVAASGDGGTGLTAVSNGAPME